MNGESELLDIVLTFHPSRSIPDFLYGWQQ